MDTQRFDDSKKWSEANCLSNPHPGLHVSISSAAPLSWQKQIENFKHGELRPKIYL